MKFRVPPPLRLPLALFAASVLLGSSAFHLALDARMVRKAEQLDAQAQADRAALDLRRTPERLAQDRAQVDIFNSLDKAGFLGSEDRIDWLSNLARMRTTLGLQHLSWRLAPRQASSLSPGLYGSRMELDLAPVDVKRLEQFLKQLRGQAHGHYTVRECLLQPDAGSATCTLDWWTWNAH